MRGRKAMGKRRMWFPTLVTAPLSLESRRDVYGKAPNDDHRSSFGPKWLSAVAFTLKGL